ncbi:hypothetical protein CYMTET_21075, partial [Cymbomonas tetramitiformis]
TVLLEHKTGNPYEATVESTGEGVVLQGLTIRHTSPSVANNYAVFLQGGSATLSECDISSTTGTAVGVEGASFNISKCKLAGAKRHGAAIYGDLFGGGASGIIEECDITMNGENGILVRDASPVIRKNAIRRNAAYGVRLADCDAEFDGNIIEGNRKGTVVTEFGAVANLSSTNTLDAKLRRL